MTTIWQRLDADAKLALAWAEHFLVTVVENEVQALAPIAMQAVGAVVADVGALASPGGIIAAIDSALPLVLKAVEQKGLQVAAGSVFTALGSAATSLARASGLGGTPAAAAAPAAPASQAQAS